MKGFHDGSDETLDSYSEEAEKRPTVASPWKRRRNCNRSKGGEASSESAAVEENPGGGGGGGGGVAKAKAKALAKAKVTQRVPCLSQFKLTKRTGLSCHLRVTRSLMPPPAPDYDEEGKTVFDEGAALQAPFAALARGTRKQYSGVCLRREYECTVQYLREKDLMRVDWDRMVAALSRMAAKEKAGTEQASKEGPEYWRQRCEEAERKLTGANDMSLKEVLSLAEAPKTPAAAAPAPAKEEEKPGGGKSGGGKSGGSNGGGGAWNKGGG